MTDHIPSRRGRRRIVLVLSAVFVALNLLAASGSASAHAALVSAEPAPGATVSEALRAIHLTFDDTLAPESQVRIFGAGFEAVPVLLISVDGSDLRATLAQRLQPGMYTVQWSAISVDGDTTQGSYEFAVTAGIGGGQGPLLTAVIAGGIGLMACAFIAFAVWRGRPNTTQ